MVFYFPNQSVLRTLTKFIFTEQGETIDTIEENVTVVANHVEEGNVELKKALKYKQKSRRMCFIFLCIVILIACIVAIIFICEIE